MQFPNALEGVKKIYKAEILDLISAVLVLLAGILALVGLGAGSGGAVLGGGFVAIAAAVLGIIAFILNLIGLNKAKLDEAGFKNALTVVIVGIVASILLGATKEGTFLNGLGDVVSEICKFLVTFFVCTGVYNLAQKLNDSAMSEKALKTRKMVMATWIVGIALSLVGNIIETVGNSSGLTTVAGVLGLVSAIAQIVSYIMYLGMLKRATVALQA